MSKLFPPILPNRVKGMYQTRTIIVDEETKPVAIYTVEFEENNANNDQDITGLGMRIRTVVNDNNRCMGTARYIKANIYDRALNPGKAKFTNIDVSQLNIGEYYKLQIAYTQQVGTGTPPSEDVGYWSTVGIMKFTKMPHVSIESDRFNFTGNYTNLDSSEKVINYRFRLDDEDSEFKVHDSSTDDSSTKSHDIYELTKLPSAGNHTLVYEVQTSSGLKTVDLNLFADSKTITVNYSENNNTSTTGRMDYNNGYVDITATGTSGVVNYLIRFAEGESEGLILKKFAAGESIEYRDFTVEQGITYTYKVGTISIASDVFTVVLSKNQNSLTVKADYEDIFLSEADSNNTVRQLKVRFNGNVDKIHETIMENKIDTIGGRYPFFSRNQQVRYRDFTISGVISFQGDEQRLFSNLYSVPEQPIRERTYTPGDQNNELIQELIANGYTSSYSDYTTDNYLRERRFREEVLAQLNDGQLKLFRSASEGILVVRLMQVNLTPFQGTSRMVYQFNAQAYEATGHEPADLRDLNYYKWG